MTLTQAIKNEAHQLGFQLVGVTTPDPPPHLETYERWLEAGRHGEMDWIASERARARRADPRLILPECRSILVLGIRYSLSPPTPHRRGEGRIASYAWGTDYHDALTEKMKVLVAFIETQIGETVPNRWYTDTGPILERDLAQRAGLGWIGKNTCLINPQQGSYFLLAEIFLGIELESDEPLWVDYCGSCTRCIEACPTDCILPDRTIDARRCISYLTIEQKGPIPLDLRTKTRDWVFGCDICQQVCPWNIRFATDESDPAFEPSPEISNWPQPELASELSLSSQEFNRKFKGSPVKRSKRRGYLRNVAVALGNRADKSAIPALIQALSDDEPLVRRHAAWALGQIGDPATLPTISLAEQKEKDYAVWEEIRAAQLKILKLNDTK